MTGRLNPGPTLTGALNGVLLRRPRNAEEPADSTTPVLLFGLPLLVVGAACATRVVLPHPGILVVAGAVLTAALLPTFAAIAMWREQARAARCEPDRVATGALDEAGAHVLVSVLVAAVATLGMAVVATVGLPDDAGTARTWLVVAAGAIGLGCWTYLVLSLVMAVNLMWDAYAD